MNNTILLFIFFGLVGTCLTAQDQLRVEYELIEPEENYRDPSLPEHVKIIIPKKFFELTLNKEESIWKSIDRISNEQTDADKGAMVARVSFGPSPIIYKNTKSEISLEESQSFSKKYLIKDSLTEFNWQITRESKEILGVKVQKATSWDKEKGVELIAWYAPKLNFKNGPDNYWGLPGLILEIKVTLHFEDNTEHYMTYIAREIEALKSNYKIKPPSKGIAVTQDEFEKINQANYKKMMERQGQEIDKD